MYAIAKITLLFLDMFKYELLEHLHKNEELTIDLGKEHLYNILSLYGSYHFHKEISYGEFIYAYKNAMQINAEAEALGFRALCTESKTYLQKLKSSKDSGALLYIPYIKGNSECLDTKIIAIYGSKILSEYAKLSSERLGRRIAENTLTLLVDLDMSCDLLGMDGCLNSNGKIIGLLKEEEDKESLLKTERILEKGGCILSLMPPAIGFSDIDINPFKISLSDADIIIERDHEVPLLEMQIQGKVPYCLSFPEKYSNKFNEDLINNGFAIGIKNHADITRLAIKLLYTHFDNCIIYCFKSSKINRYFDKIWILTDDVPQDCFINQSKQYDITQVELVINNDNTIIEVIDHTKKRIYRPLEECKISIDNFNKYSVLYDVQNNFYNCSFTLNYHTSNILTIYIEPISRKQFMYEIQSNTLEDDDIKIQMNDRHELVFVFDKVKEIYFFPAEDQIFLGFYEGNAYTFNEVNTGLKLYIKNNLTDILNGKVSEVAVNNLKKNILSRLPQNAVLMNLGVLLQEVAVECKYEIICSLIDEIIDVGGDEILKTNLKLIDECIDDNSRYFFEVEDVQEPV